MKPNHQFAGRLQLVLAVACAVLWIAPAPAEARPGPKRPAPLFEGLGDSVHPVTTHSALAQRYFNQGMVLLYNFNHQEAIRSFRAVAELDPDCAMAHWGIAYAYGPNINQPMDTASAVAAWDALQVALEKKSGVSPREQAYIDALARRYSSDPNAERAPLDAAYADAMREVMRAWPDDLDAATLFAEAVLDTMPWDYWQPDRRPKPPTVEVIGVLRSVLRHDPKHPGANHFFIHVVEAGPNPEDGLPAADMLRSLNLEAGHLAHMPSHIYIRTGRYADAIDVNALAAKIDRRYISQCRAQGFYPATYYPHNVHFEWFANVMAGCSRDAIRLARKIEEMERDVRCSPNALVEAPRFRHLLLLTLARFGHWDEVTRIPQPAEEFPLDRAMWHYAQGIAAVAKGDAELAAGHLSEMRGIGRSKALEEMNSPAFPATSVHAVAEAVLAGKVALARGETSRGLDHLRKAVQLEDEIPYMEPPYWHAPTRQTLGAALLATDNAADAEGVFRADLDRNPRNGWSLYGLRESLSRQHKDVAAEAVGREFAASWTRADTEPRLETY